MSALSFCDSYVAHACSATLSGGGEEPFAPPTSTDHTFASRVRVAWRWMGSLVPAGKREGFQSPILQASPAAPLQVVLFPQFPPVICETPILILSIGGSPQPIID
uniref:Uncharacterized protein n=1 Tax=Trieres chinensis TaxID=1514140 RepID=A0A7S2EDB7_TRICV